MGGFQMGWQLGSNAAQSQNRHKQIVGDEERQVRSTELMNGIDQARKKLATLQPNSPEYQQLSNDISAAHAQLTDLYHPRHGPGALMALGKLVSERLLHRPTSTDAPRIGETPSTPATPGTTMPPMAGAAVPLTTPDLPPIAGSPHLAPPPVTPAVAKQQAEALAVRLGNEAVQDPQAEAARASTYNREQKTLDMDALQDWAKRHNVPPDAILELTEHQLGLPVAKGAKPLTGSKPYQGADGKWYQSMVNPSDGSIVAEPMPADYKPPVSTVRPTQYSTQRASYAASIGKTPDTLTWQDERAFLKQRAVASQPYGGARLLIAEQQEELNQARFALQQTETGMKDFLALNKALAMPQKLQAVAERAMEYVSKPSGEGDAALTLAFVDAIKPGSGFRFTDAERRWITTGSRGILDGAYQRIQQGETGETLTPEQRTQMASVIKTAAAQVAAQSAKLLAGAAAFDPGAAAAAGGPPVAPASAPTTPGTLKKKAKSIAKPWPGAPAIGTVEDGHKYMGGDPAQQSSWQPVTQ